MPRVLVVDDDLTVAEVVLGYLRRDGFEAAHAADCLSALTIAAAAPPDIVVLDLMLPGIDGLEVCRRLRAVNPSPYMVYMQAPGCILVASSPEILCRVRREATERGKEIEGEGR